MNRQIMIAKIEHTGIHPRLGSGQTIPIYLVLAHGYTDLTKNAEYDTDKHQIYEEDPLLGDILEEDWYRNPTSGEYQQTAP
jgi:hypothetical protein